TYLTFNNDKPWFTAKLRQLRQVQEDAYGNGERVLYNPTRNTLNKEIRMAKRNYAEKLEYQFSSSDTASVWKGLKDITNCTIIPVPKKPKITGLNDYKHVALTSVVM
ncbi:hypothetical protein M9458_039910, partial [Cirrhinus mrigala]